jgi:opacity protein-like surface antigen
MKKNLLLSAFAALILTAAIAPVAANAAEFGMPQSSLFQHQGPYDNTGHGPSQSGLEGGGG